MNKLFLMLVLLSFSTVTRTAALELSDLLKIYTGHLEGEEKECGKQLIMTIIKKEPVVKVFKKEPAKKAAKKIVEDIRKEKPRLRKRRPTIKK